MLLILLAILFFTIIFGYVNLTDHREHSFYCYLKRCVFPGIILILMGCVVAGMTISVSYGTYLSARTSYDSIIAQYRGAVELYGDKAVLHVEQAVTDFKYEGYQTAMSDMIKDLRATVVSYNKSIISKRVIAQNRFFKGLIVQPDPDMVPINIIE